MGISLSILYIYLSIAIIGFIIMSLLMGNVINFRDVTPIKEILDKNQISNKYTKYILKGMKIYCRFKLKKHNECIKRISPITEETINNLLKNFYNIYKYHLVVFLLTFIEIILIIITIYLTLDDNDDCIAYKIFIIFIILTFSIICGMFAGIYLELGIISPRKGEILNLINACDEGGPETTPT
jgi:uncharacterized membrane protein YbhN (UPF0104 family)